MKKIKKIIAIVMATLIVLAIGMVYASAVTGMSGSYASGNATYNAQHSISSSYFSAYSQAWCSSGHTARTSTSTMVNYTSGENDGRTDTGWGYIGTFAHSDVAMDLDETVESYESDHYFYYDGILYLEVYLPTGTAY